MPAALAAAVAAVLLASAPAAASVPARPAIINLRLPDYPQRIANLHAYSLRVYGTDRIIQRRPKLIMEHWTASQTAMQAWNYWASNPNSAYTHFIIDTDGTIRQDMPTWLMPRQQYGIDQDSIGIEHAGTRDSDVMSNPAMLKASLRLTCWLAFRHGIQVRNVIGHAEALTHPFYEPPLPPELQWKTHDDMRRSSMSRYRHLLAVSCPRLKL